jgi:hypothetical protein
LYRSYGPSHWLFILPVGYLKNHSKFVVDYISDQLFFGRSATLFYVVALIPKLPILWTFIAGGLNVLAVAYDYLLFSLVRNELVAKAAISVGVGTCSSFHSTFTTPFGTNSVILLRQLRP